MIAFSITFYLQCKKHIMFSLKALITQEFLWPSILSTVAATFLRILQILTLGIILTPSPPNNLLVTGPDRA